MDYQGIKEKQSFIIIGLFILLIFGLLPWISSRHSNDEIHHRTIRRSENENCEYDFIVVGSGPGGATIATRLALNNFKVLLIEAGPDYDDEDTRTPFNPYLFSTEDNITIQYPRAITLGGSSQINGMVAMTANPLEWDYIAQVTNDPTWNYENIENNYQSLVENCLFCSNNKEKNGWFNISISDYQSPSSTSPQTNPVLTSLLNTINSNFQFNENILENNSYDSWSPIPEFVGQNPYIRSGAYRRIKNVQAIKPSYLSVWTNSFVTKLIIDPKTKQTLGVQYINGSNLYKANILSSPSLNSNQLKQYSVYAKREVIVSGGQWMTPQLLQLSGIGDKNLLKKLNIEVIEDLPGVGQNQQDQNELPFILKLKENFSIAGINSSICTFNTTPNDPCRGVATGGSSGALRPPPASEDFVFFERRNRKKYFFSGV